MARLLLCLLVLGSTSIAGAQSHPDVVISADGGMVRGSDWLVGVIGGEIVVTVSEIVGLILALQGDAAELTFD